MPLRTYYKCQAATSRRLADQFITSKVAQRQMITLAFIRAPLILLQGSQAAAVNPPPRERHHHLHLHVAETPGLPAEQAAVLPGVQQTEQAGMPAAKQYERPGHDWFVVKTR